MFAFLQTDGTGRCAKYAAKISASDLAGVCKYYIGPSATCLCRVPQPPPPPLIPRLGIDRQCTHSLHRNDMAYCHYKLCREWLRARML